MGASLSIMPTRNRPSMPGAISTTRYDLTKALAWRCPVTATAPSPRAFPEALPAIDYAPQDTVVTVLSNGLVKFKGHDIKVSNALRGLPIAFRPDDTQDGIYTLYFAHHRLARIDMREAD